MPDYKNAVCRGSFALGTACGSCERCLEEIAKGNGPTPKVKVDNTFSDHSKPFRRFFLERMKDETGVSRTGRVLEGVITQSGKVITEWRPPHSTIGVYNSFEEFKLIHVDCHPSCNVVRFIERAETWHCFGCGAGGNDGNFCQMCGTPSTGYDSAFVDYDPTNPRVILEKNLERLNNKMKNALTEEEQLIRYRTVQALNHPDDFTSTEGIYGSVETKVSQSARRERL